MSKINIVMSVNNEEEYIEEMLLSLSNQKFKEWKLIIRDNNSNDNSREIIKKYAKKDPRIVLLKDNNEILPLYISFDKALEHIDTDSEYIMFADGDDVWLPNKIEISLKKIQQGEKTNKKNLPILCFTDLKVVDSKLKLIHSSMRKQQGNQNVKFQINHSLLTSLACGNTFIFNKALLNISRPIPLGAIMHDVWFFNVALLFGKIYEIKKATILYRQHHGNFSGSQFYIQNIISNFINFSQIKHKINNRVILSNLLLNRFEKNLTYKNKKKLYLLSKIKNLNFFEKQKIISKYKFKYNNFLKNLIFRLFI